MPLPVAEVGEDRGGSTEICNPAEPQGSNGQVQASSVEDIHTWDMCTWQQWYKSTQRWQEDLLAYMLQILKAAHTEYGGPGLVGGSTR